MSNCCIMQSCTVLVPVAPPSEMEPTPIPTSALPRRGVDAPSTEDGDDIGLMDLIAALVGRMLRTRWLVRAPVVLYRLRHGWLFGQRMLLMQHRGRHSGIARYVVLEVVEHPRSDRYVIVSGFGEAAQWYRNVLNDPRVRISVGRRRDAPAVARSLAPDDAEAVLSRYAEHHPTAWRRLRHVLELARDIENPALPMFALDVDEHRAEHQEK